MKKFIGWFLVEGSGHKRQANVSLGGLRETYRRDVLVPKDRFQIERHILRFGHSRAYGVEIIVFFWPHSNFALFP